MSSSARAIRSRHHTRMARQLAVPFPVYMPHPFQQEGDPFDDGWDENDDGYDCTRCGGEGFDQVDDPLWDECDEFGWGPCNACSGTGLRSHQTIF